MNDNKVMCIECNKEFEIKEILEKKVEDIEVKYFVCPHCNEKYIVSCIDDYIKREQRMYKLIKDTYKRQRRLKDMKIHSDKLRHKVIDRL